MHPGCEAFSFSRSHLLKLGPTQANVWVAFVDESFEAVAHRADVDVLSRAEWDQLGNFVFGKDRRRYQVTRLLVRHATLDIAERTPPQ